MKLRFIYTTFCLLLGATLWMSNSLGRAAGGGGNATVAGCGGGSCHKGGTFQGKTTLSVKKNGAEVTKYSPGETYDVSFLVEKTAGAAAFFGFQMTASVGTKDAGVFSAVAAGANSEAQISTLGTRTFVEHKLKMASGAVNMKWTAPAKGTGNVTFFAVGNIVDGKSGNAGDSPIAPINVVLAEGSVSALELPTWASSITLTPNPANEVAMLNIQSNENKNLDVQIFDLNGKVFSTRNAAVNAGENYIPLEISDLAKGIYLLTVKSDGNVTTRKFVKL